MDLNRLTENKEQIMGEEIISSNSQTAMSSHLALHVQKRRASLDTIFPNGYIERNFNEIHCYLCGSSSAQSRCNQCNTYFCNECYNVYHKHPRRSHHFAQTLNRTSTPVAAIISKTESQHSIMSNYEKGQPSEVWKTAKEIPQVVKDRPGVCNALQKKTFNKEGDITTGHTIPRNPNRLFNFDKKGEGQWKCERCLYINSAKARVCNICCRRINKHSSLPSNLHSVFDQFHCMDPSMDDKKIRMIQGEYDIATREKAIQVLQLIDKGYLPIIAVKEVNQLMGEVNNHQHMQNIYESECVTSPMPDIHQSSPKTTIENTSQKQNPSEDDLNQALSSEKEHPCTSQGLVGKDENKSSAGCDNEIDVLKNEELMDSIISIQEMSKQSPKSAYEEKQSSRLIEVEVHREENDSKCELMPEMLKTTESNVESPIDDQKHETQKPQDPSIQSSETKECVTEPNECEQITRDSCDNISTCVPVATTETILKDVEVDNDNASEYGDVQMRQKVTQNGFNNGNPWKCTVCQSINIDNVCKICAQSKSTNSAPVKKALTKNNRRTKIGFWRRASLDYKGSKSKSRNLSRQYQSGTQSCFSSANGLASNIEGSVHGSTLKYNQRKSRSQKNCIII